MCLTQCPERKVFAMEQIANELKKMVKAGMGAVAAGMEKTQEAIDTFAKRANRFISRPNPLCPKPLIKSNRLSTTAYKA